MMTKQREQLRPVNRDPCVEHARGNLGPDRVLRTMPFACTVLHLGLQGDDETIGPDVAVAVNNFVIRDDVGDAEFRSGGCGCKGATPFVAASSSVSTFAMALVGALLPKRRRKERRET